MTVVGGGGLKLVGDITLMLLQLRLCKSTVKLILRRTQEPNGGSITWCVVDGRVVPPAPTRDGVSERSYLTDRRNQTSI